jgi:hypothetical protein
VSKNPRDHGYGDSPKVIGYPTVGEKLPQKCPGCGCLGLFPIKVELAEAPAALRRPTEPHQIIGNYFGCAACPWASAMMTSAVILEAF